MWITGCTEIDANTHEIEVERELDDGTTTTEKQTLVRSGDDWKIKPGGNITVDASPGDGGAVTISVTSKAVGELAPKP